MFDPCARPHAPSRELDLGRWEVYVRGGDLSGALRGNPEYGCDLGNPDEMLRHLTTLARYPSLDERL
jgi:hypothetical protein